MAIISRRPVASSLALIASSALLAGCFTVEATFTINDDDTADIGFVTVIDTERLAGFAELFGEDTSELDGLSGDELLAEMTGGDDPCADLISDFADYDVTTREIDDDGQVGVGCTVSGVPIAELNALSDDTSTFSIERDDDGTRFRAVLEGLNEITGEDAETSEMTSLLGLDPDELFTIRFVVTAPGTLGDNNATSTSGSTATWDITTDSDFVADGDATLSAEWTPGGGSGGSSTVWIVIAVIAAIIAAAAVVLLITRSRKSSASSASADQPAATPADAPPAPPASPAPPAPPAPPASPTPSTSTPPPPPPPSPGSTGFPPPSS